MHVRPGRGRLEPFVEQIWYLEDVEAGAGAEPTPIFPDGRMELVLQLGASMRQIDAAGSRLQPRALLVGHTIDTVTVAPTGAMATLGVSFKPAGAAAWFLWRQDEVV